MIVRFKDEIIIKKEVLKSLKNDGKFILKFTVPGICNSYQDEGVKSEIMGNIIMWTDSLQYVAVHSVKFRGREYTGENLFIRSLSSTETDENNGRYKREQDLITSSRIDQVLIHYHLPSPLTKNFDDFVEDSDYVIKLRPIEELYFSYNMNRVPERKLREDEEVQLVKLMDNIFSNLSVKFPKDFPKDLIKIITTYLSKPITLNDIKVNF
jgi:hypothetical protein